MRWISILLVITMVLGCASMQPVDHSNWGTLTSQVQAGETVKVTTRDGQTRSFVVTEVTSDAIVGQDVRIPQSEITALQVKAEQQGRGKTIGIIALIAVVLAAALAGGGGGSGSGGY